MEYYSKFNSEKHCCLHFFTQISLVNWQATRTQQQRMINHVCTPFQKWVVQQFQCLLKLQTVYYFILDVFHFFLNFKTQINDFSPHYFLMHFFKAFINCNNNVMVQKMQRRTTIQCKNYSAIRGGSAQYHFSTQSRKS